MDPTLLKIILLLVMVVAMLVAGLIPLRVLKRLRHSAARAATSQEHRNVSLVLCLLTCFSGGVFLATCFLHLFPELQANVRSISFDYDIQIDYPIAELLSCMGFFLLFFLEEVVIMAIPSMAHGHSHGHHATENAKHEEERALGVVEGGCCMGSGPAAKSPVEKKTLLSDGAKEAMVVSVESQEDVDGHCQKHCPLTVHRRLSAGHGECTENGNEIYTTVILAEPERCETNCEKVDEDPPILMKSSPHAHSHGVRSVTMVLAISFHAIIEGMAFGVQSEYAKIWALFLSLLVHKIIVAFSVGLQLARTHAHQLRWVVLSMVVLSLTSPVGAVLGMILETSSMDSFVKDCLITFCQGLAVGTFLYVTFFEVLLHERDNEHPNLLKLVVMLVGFALIGLLRLVDDHEHDLPPAGVNGTARVLLLDGHHDHDHDGPHHHM